MKKSCMEWKLRDKQSAYEQEKKDLSGLAENGVFSKENLNNFVMGIYFSVVQLKKWSNKYFSVPFNCTPP